MKRESARDPLRFEEVRKCESDRCRPRCVRASVDGV